MNHQEGIDVPHRHSHVFVTPGFVTTYATQQIDRLRRSRCGTVLCAALLLSACDGPQSALAPAGRDAEQIATLFYWMVGGGVVVWLIVMSLSLYAIRRKKDEPNRNTVRLYIVGGGALFPTIVLTALLTYGLGKMPELLEHGPEDGPKIHVTGEQWWWRVRYEFPDGRSFELANEVRLPVGTRYPLWLRTADVIHALWVPSISGKTDMIPGRVNRMALHPNHTGVFRGVCAEYCGLSHAKMAFAVLVHEPPDFERWVAAQLRPAPAPTTELTREGARLFDSLGCGACHTVRGTKANGEVGPDLTHVGSRQTLGAGILENEPTAFLRWLTELHDFKPGVKMPSFGMLPEAERQALAAYLESLE